MNRSSMLLLFIVLVTAIQSNNMSEKDSHRVQSDDDCYQKKKFIPHYACGNWKDGECPTEGCIRVLAGLHNKKNIEDMFQCKKTKLTCKSPEQVAHKRDLELRKAREMQRLAQIRLQKIERQEQKRLLKVQRRRQNHKNAPRNLKWLMKHFSVDQV